ncbi:MAG: putative beta-lysine N-acetyltransferase [Cyclobacteriaceae bacterium]|nr:putative beta-lysine N-acetyltransferase [Cyclobacteriaceae bacterium]
MINLETLYHGATLNVYRDEFSRRLRLDQYEGPLNDVVAGFEANAPAWVEKLIIKSHTKDVSHFLNAGYQKEASIAGYFKGENMAFLAKYVTPSRRVSRTSAAAFQLFRDLTDSSPVASVVVPIQHVERSSPDDAEEIASIFASTFPVYPTPVQDARYVRKTMEQGTCYAHVREGGKIVSVASAEINDTFANAELTDCASLPSTQGRGYMKQILSWLEAELLGRGIRCHYTIARTESLAMNRVFHSLGYTFGGTMTNNCMIYSGLEDMNVWYKNFGL